MVRFMIVSVIWMLIGMAIIIVDFVKIAHCVWKRSNENEEMYHNVGSIFVDYIFDVDLINKGILIFVMVFCWPYTVFRMETGIRKIWKNYISNAESES